jgi:Fe-S cluster biogenesis protein NfuA
MSSAPIKILAKPARDPDVCYFEVDRILVKSNRKVHVKGEQNAKSAFMKELFAFGLSEVLIETATMIVSKAAITGAENAGNGKNWSELGREIGPHLRKYLALGDIAFAEEEYTQSEVSKNTPAVESPGDLSIKEQILAIIEEEINPSLASHGGAVKIENVQQGDVYLRMDGGCQGCSQSRETMRNGIEVRLREAIPSIKNIIDVTDHDSGENPYFS